MSDPVRVRPYQRGDEPHVRRIFRETLLLGRPLDFELSDRRRYEHLCLGWFLTRGVADVGVLEQDGRVRGYVLVCTDLRSYHRWAAVVASQWTISSLARLATRRVHDEEARFHRLRIADGWHALLHSPTSPMPALVHVNLDRDVRAALAGRELTRYADMRCDNAGLPGWFAEINARRGSRVRAFAAIGLEPVHQTPNLTLSALLGEPVDRFTVVHRIDKPIGRRLSAA
jgi:hypothetical protein